VLRTMVGTRRAELGLGCYPTASLSQALEYAREALQQICSGVDPAAQRRAQRVTLEWTFERTALASIEVYRAGWENAKHGLQWERTLKAYAYPVFGQKHVRLQCGQSLPSRPEWCLWLTKPCKNTS
jgi:hypothetical protein